MPFPLIFISGPQESDSEKGEGSADFDLTVVKFGVSLFDNAPNYLVGCVIQKRIGKLGKENWPLSTIMANWICSH